MRGPDLHEHVYRCQDCGEIQNLNEELEVVYRKGVVTGVEMYSWMKDGVTYVGTTGKTLKGAIKEIEQGAYPL